MLSLDETRWLMFHFDGDPVERESIRLTKEILETVAVVLFAIVAIKLFL